jgi:Ferredoxin-like domain in Api92-like protein
MPNRNTNIVKIFAREAQVREYLIVREDMTHFNMHKLFPEHFPADDLAGYNNWDYEWACTNTGARGFPDIHITSEPDDDVTCLGYETAWTPNTGTLARLHELTGRRIECEYEEPGNGFEGTFACIDGQNHDDERAYRPYCDSC